MDNNKTASSREGCSVLGWYKQQVFFMGNKVWSFTFRCSLSKTPGNDFKVTILIGLTSNLTITGLWNIEAKSRLDRSNTIDKSILKSIQPYENIRWGYLKNGFGHEISPAHSLQWFLNAWKKTESRQTSIQTQLSILLGSFQASWL